MKIVFCSEPFYPYEPDYAYREDVQAAQRNGFAIELFSFEDLTENNVSGAFRRIKPYDEIETAFYRGWMLKPKFYEILYSELESRNLKLINSPEEYRHCHYFPESYEIIKNYTPQSIFVSYGENFDFEDLHQRLTVFGGKPLVLKDYVKSRKHEWNEACFIRSAANRKAVESVVERFLELQGEDINEGLVFREFVEFQPLANHSKSGMPLTKEFRLFFLKGKLICASEYWEEGGYSETNPPQDLFADVATRVKSNFFTMDVAQKTDGKWLIVELGDAQVAGLPEKIDRNKFYEAIQTFL